MSSKQKLVGNLKKGLVFVVSAPAGTGKTTLVGMLTKEFDAVKTSISYTTRRARPHENHGDHYYFVSEEEFCQKIERGEFLEHVELFGSRYGTAFDTIEKQTEKGHHVVLVIDTQGAIQLMQKVKAIFIFLLPPSLIELRERLEARGTETAQVIEERLSLAEKEIALACHYDYHIVNDDLATAYQALKSIVIAEEHRVRKSIEQFK